MTSARTKADRLMRTGFLRSAGLHLVIKAGRAADLDEALALYDSAGRLYDLAREVAALDELPLPELTLSEVAPE